MDKKIIKHDTEIVSCIILFLSFILIMYILSWIGIFLWQKVGIDFLVIMAVIVWVLLSVEMVIAIPLPWLKRQVMKVVTGYYEDAEREEREKRYWERQKKKRA